MILLKLQSVILIKVSASRRNSIDLGVNPNIHKINLEQKHVNKK